MVLLTSGDLLDQKSKSLLFPGVGGNVVHYIRQYKNVRPLNKMLLLNQ